MLLSDTVRMVIIFRAQAFHAGIGSETRAPLPSFLLRLNLSHREIGDAPLFSRPIPQAAASCARKNRGASPISNFRVAVQAG